MEWDCKVGDICHQHGVIQATGYRWKARPGGMEVSDMRRLKKFQAGKRKLKDMFANHAFRYLS